VRILFAGDWHGNTNHALRVLAKAVIEGVDVVVQCGDFGAWEHTSSGVEYLDALERYLIDLDLTLYWVDGNHDKWSETLRLHGDRITSEGFIVCRQRVFYLPRGLRWTWDDVSFLALGGAYSVDKAWRLQEENERYLKQVRRASYDGSVIPVSQAGFLWFPEEEITDEQEKLAITGGHVDVMVTHDKPIQSQPRWNRKDILECRPNAERVQRVLDETKPYLLVHGHLHFRYSDRLPRHGDESTRFTQVEGLDADLETAAVAGWGFGDSYLIIDTSQILAMKAADPR